MPAATREPAGSAPSSSQAGDRTFIDLVADVAEWATGVTGRPTVIGAGARSDAADDTSVVLHPYTIGSTGRQQPRDAVEATAHVLVFAAADDVAAAHAVTTLALTALAQADYDIDLTPTSDQTWTALGLSPRPSFAIAGPVRLHVDRPSVPRVLHPLNLRTARLRVLSGDVRSTEGTGLTPATVRLVPHGPVTQVGADGRWSLPIPSAQPAILDVSTKGVRVRHTVGADEVDVHVVVDLGLPAATTAPPASPPAASTDPAGKD